jgi:hypothetical protein
MCKRISLGLIVACTSFSALAQSPPLDALNKLRALPAPRQQMDLDTTRIVSIERTMAASAEERRSGLWQSWRVAVCRGCGIGDQRTVAEIEAAADAYVRPGDRQLLGRPKTLQPVEVGQLLQEQDRSTPRIVTVELSTPDWGLTVVGR